MTRDSNSNDFAEILKGFGLLMLFHILAAIIIFVLGFIVGPLLGDYNFFTFWIFGIAGFLFWQLLYVIPILLQLKRRRKIGMMKGVIVGAAFTALLNSVGFLLLMVR
ncbi:hypothetical protein ACQ4M3_05820 [Leptolyngbya sp. AN03gr2]|uniref:hypothetical protein n=1 Tax=unclassified Leptolyngbya TaxID=2650499 RepID=UPI003D3230C5